MSNPDPQHDAENERTDDDLLRQEDDARRLEDAQAVENEQRRAEEEQFDMCPKHPDRPLALGSGNGKAFHLRACAECVAESLSYVPHVREPWEDNPSYDMRDYSDAPRAHEGLIYKGKERK